MTSAESEPRYYVRRGSLFWCGAFGWMAGYGTGMRVPPRAIRFTLKEAEAFRNSYLSLELAT